MDEKFYEILSQFRPCFSRRATYYWFLLIMIGLVVRSDHFGVTSFIRWLSLAPENYWPMLHFFVSSGWTLQGVLLCWWIYCLQESSCFKVQGRAVMLGDHTNQPKDGRKMPGMVTIHQDSETSSKPGYFRGHVFGFIAILMQRFNKGFAVPLWGELNMESRNEKDSNNMTTRIVSNTITIALKLNCPAYLVLDAFFAVGPVFLKALGVYSIATKEVMVHIITRAKKNIVAYKDPPPKPPGKKGPNKKYGEKLKLIKVISNKEYPRKI